MPKPIFAAAATAALAAQLAACASLPESVEARDVSPAQYAAYDCDQVRQEMARVGVEVDRLYGVQGQRVARDWVVFGAGVATAFWPAVFLLAGDGKEDELAELKGQQVALEKTAIENHCPVAEELAAARAAR
jgi:hypothetical protein